MFRDRSWWWGPFCLFMLIGAAIGFFVGTAFSERLNSALTERSDLRKACVDGNDRACRMYEIEYRRRGFLE